MRLERLWAATRRIPLSNSCIRCTCRRATGRSTRGGIPRIASKFPKHSQEHFVRTKCHGCSKRWLWEMPHIGTFFPCQLLTGARRDEARLLKWAHLDLDRGPLALAHDQDRRAADLPLPAQLVSRLRQLSRLTEWVFPSSRNSRKGMQAGNGRSRPWSLVGGASESKWV